MLKRLLEEFIKTGAEDKLMEHLASNSNLPGPRGNLELANAFADALPEYKKPTAEKLWKLCIKMTSVSAVEAPVNSAGEFIPFCGAVGMGSIAAVHSGYFQKALSRLRELASDPRWRMREAVAMGLQRMITSNADAVLKNLKKWVSGGNLLELRAVAAAVAEPALLKNPKTARAALQLNQKIIGKVMEVEDRKSEDFRVLRKALGYTLSVVIVPLPKEGFEYLRQFARTNDPDIYRIIKENLKKNRLLKNFPKEVESLKKLLN